jgi:NhaP-type Na+/H+ or K+/H+ antiporter
MPSSIRVGRNISGTSGRPGPSSLRPWRTQHAEAQPKASLVLFLFLPPLVYTSAWQTSWRELRASLWPILLPAIGLV